MSRHLRPFALSAVGVAAVAMLSLTPPQRAAAAPIATASDYDCSDFSSQAEAQEYLEPGDPYGLDADNDGIACESNPCPCSGEAGTGTDPGPTAPAPPPEPPKLKQYAAKRAALAVARRFDRRLASVAGIDLNRCTRRSKYRVDCGLLTDGHTPNSETRCRLAVRVSGSGSSASAKLRSTCRTYPVLSAERASAAIHSEADRLADKPAEVFAITRHSRLYFEAQASWTTASAPREECSAGLVAGLASSGHVSVRVRELECVPT